MEAQPNQMPSEDPRGSLLQCQLLTDLPRSEAAKILTDIASPFITIDPEHDKWMPQGLLHPAEARLDTALGFLSEVQQKQLQDWWLRVLRSANTPNWDIASTCTIEGRRGLVLVEAKAHTNELDASGKSLGSPTRPPSEDSKENHAQIGAAIQEANTGLNSVMPGWELSRDAHYQLSNRFAWAWKLATLKIQVVLVYLGFRNVAEMSKQGRPFTSQEDWEQGLRAYATGTVPEVAWGKRLDIAGTPLIPLIRSLEVRFLP